MDALCRSGRHGPRGSSRLEPLAFQTGIDHRRDIDGLRALAVMPVVFFHAGLTGFHGGFVGVDIFFVISGYLITSIIVTSFDGGRNSLAWFYERRIRRILPAFVAMVIATTVAGVILLPPLDLADFGLSALTAAGFSSNIFFSNSVDYFAGPKYMMPLLHTWSLGVEEQFYILWPFLLLACYRIGLRRGGVILLAAFIVACSLTYAQAAMTTTGSAGVFYLPQARVWELMLGAILAFHLVPKIAPLWLRNALGLLGVGLILFAITQFSSTTPFPGVWALFPCLGAALIIHTGQNGDTIVSKALSFGVFVFIGLISYSLYLWHWPIFAFAQNYWEHPFNSGEAVILIVSSIQTCKHAEMHNTRDQGRTSIRCFSMGRLSR